ncbi:MAG: hypothetical protein Q8L29_00845 [archaeon]|nr:hypothetical protein [archaeon]
MNKRGDVPTILLFVTAIALVLSSLFIFATFGNNFTNSKQVAEMNAEIEFSQKYITKEVEIMIKDIMINIDADCQQKDLKTRFGCVALKRESNRLSIAGNLFGLIRNDEFEIINQEENYVLEIPNINVKSVRGANSVEKNFDLRIAFFSDGMLVFESDRLG